MKKFSENFERLLGSVVEYRGGYRALSEYGIACRTLEAVSDGLSNIGCKVTLFDESAYCVPMHENVAVFGHNMNIVTEVLVFFSEEDLFDWYYNNKPADFRIPCSFEPRIGNDGTRHERHLLWGGTPEIYMYEK